MGTQVKQRTSKKQSKNREGSATPPIQDSVNSSVSTSTSTTSNSGASSATKKPKKTVSFEDVDDPNTNATEFNNKYCLYKWVITAIAFIVRAWRLGAVDEVVFDEVHFGKFASHYLVREFFFDVHPPLGKLMFAFIGWLVGYDGSFKFGTIGDNLTLNHVPFIAYRSLPVVLGTAVVFLVFSTLQECNFSPYACLLGAALIALDSAQVVQSRHILLDDSLLFYMICAVFCYVKFAKQGRNAFGVHWWKWLVLTGVSLSSVISVKYVGLFTFIMIGAAVIANLLNMYDIRGKKPEDQMSLTDFGKHFGARFATLVVMPFLLYLFWFYVHFKILRNSGPGDNFMTHEFQSTLHDNPVSQEAMDVHYYDFITLKSVPLDIYLHSHPEKYPIPYTDGRISSGGQQVTGYTHEDPNNQWQIYPVTDSLDERYPADPLVGSQNVMLRHVRTNSFLLAHDVASPGYRSHEEFTTAPPDWAFGKGHQNCIFRIEIVDGGPHVRSRVTHFRLQHVATPVSMWLSDKKLPDWGFNQFEVNGNKNMVDSGTLWSFGKVEGLTPEEEQKRFTSVKNGVVPRRPFLTDYKELQGEMFRSNSRLTATHPYMSNPWTWPLLLRGISFWARTGGKNQIYFIGNHIGWYLINFAIVLFSILFTGNLLMNMRNVSIIPTRDSHLLNTTLLWFFFGWLAHYLPFFFMGRQLFLHHYLPSHVIGSMLTAGMLDMTLGSCKSTKKLAKYIVLVLVLGIAAHFLYFSPLVYAYNLEPEKVHAREWFNIVLHHSKPLST